MAAIATAFTSAFVLASAVNASSCAALGATIETFFAAPYVLNANAAAAPTSTPAGAIQRFIGADAGAYQMIVVDAFGGKPALRLRRANGTGAAPTAIASADTLGEVEFTGYYTSGGTAYATLGGAVRGEATQAWTSAAQGTRLVFQTTPNSTATPVDVFWIGQDGSALAKGPIGYNTGVGAGGSITQLTSRTTGVTLNTACGQITLFSAASSSSGQQFTLTNSFIGANDVVVLSVTSPGGDKYFWNVQTNAGSALITIYGTLGVTEAAVIDFVIIKGSIT
jgi:hypothetical protein